MFSNYTFLSQGSQMATHCNISNSSFLLDSDFLAGEGDRVNERQVDAVTKIKDTMDNIWTTLRRGWGKKNTIAKSIQGMCFHWGIFFLFPIS